MKRFATLLILVCLAGFAAQAQTSTATIVGQYSCITLGSAGLTVTGETDAYKMTFCKDLITNTCETHALAASITPNGELQDAKGAVLKGLSAKVTHQGNSPIIEITLPDGVTMEFVRR
jgi:cytolysin (calcineurin-like family phosphatase)